MSIFELVDSTDDENYWTLGVWLSLEEALAALAQCKEPSELGSERWDWDGYGRVEIRERKVGWSGIGKVVLVQEWKQHYDETNDEDVWEIVQPKLLEPAIPGIEKGNP